MPSYGFMSAETVRRMLGSVRSDLSAGDRLHIAFQGGEPTLAGTGFFRDFFKVTDALMEGIRVDYVFQTNGLNLDEDWCALFLEREVLLGISIDGPASGHNALRPDFAGQNTYSRVHRTMELLKHCNIPFNVLTVLTSTLARHPVSVWNWIIKERIEYIQFIPCLAPLDERVPAPYALTPSRFRDFYLQLFPLWKKSMSTGSFTSVKFFDDLINLYLGKRVTACGISGSCTVQYIVEANGDVFPCDFYVLDHYRMGSLLTASPSELYSAAESFLTESRAYMKEPPCLGCRYEKSCAGGCKRQRDSMYVEKGICQYAVLLDQLLPPLLHFAEDYLSSRL